MSVHRLLIDFARRHWLNYLGAALCLICIVLLQAWIPRHIGRSVDSLAQRPGIDQLTQASLLLVAAAVAIYFFRAGWRLFLYNAVYKLGIELRMRLYRLLSAQGPGFYQNHRTGDLMAAATNDIDAIETAAGEGALAGFDGSFTFAVMLVAMGLALDWPLVIAILAPFPFMAIGFSLVAARIHRASKLQLEAFGKLNDHVHETLSGVRTIRALGLNAIENRRFGELAKSATKHSYEAQRWEASFEPVVGLSMTLAFTAALGVGTWLIWQQRLTVGQLTSVGLYLGYLIWPMFALGWVMSLTARAKAAWARLERVLNEPLVVQDQGQQTELRPVHIEFDRVSFKYPGQNRTALDPISFNLTAGSMLGLVGPTGAGKSTILKLILRQWNPDQGEIRWNHKPLAAYQLEALRQAVAWVPQEPILFSTSVAENIGLGQPQASREQIEQAAWWAAVDEDIQRLPQGYDTIVGERGITLSGGQKQRIAIARALLTQAPLLLLDDALSAVDTQTEAKILARLREVNRERTVVVVTHRLSSVLQADQILVLQQGRIIQQGTHQTLLEQAAQSLWYARQWRFQQIQDSLDAA